MARGGRHAEDRCREGTLTSADQAIARLLLRDADGLAKIMTDRVSTELPMLGDFPPQVAAETRAWPARVTIASLRLMVKGENLDALGPDIEATARRRRAQQVDQEQAMRSYEFAQQALVDEVT